MPITATIAVAITCGQLRLNVAGNGYSTAVVIAGKLGPLGNRNNTHIGAMAMLNKRMHADILADFDRLLALGKAEPEAMRIAVQNAQRSGADRLDAEIAVTQYRRYRGSSLDADGVLA